MLSSLSTVFEMLLSRTKYSVISKLLHNLGAIWTHYGAVCKSILVHVAQYSVLELLTRVAGSWVWFYQWYVCLLYICSFLLSYYKLLYTWVSMFKQFWYNKHVMARWTCVVSSGAIGRIVVNKAIWMVDITLHQSTSLE